MIADQETNFVYFSELLPQRYPSTFEEISGKLKKHKIGFGLLADTKDIWCRDYMPIQVSENSFVQFKYDPSYLQRTKKDRATITDTSRVCKSLGIDPVMSDIKLDGGNIVKSNKKVVMTERIFSENPGYSRDDLVKELKKLLGVEQIITIPEDSKDEMGHVDGMVRFLSEEAVFVNNYSKEDESLRERVKNSLNKANMKLVSVPYAPYKNKNGLYATGIYINYLRVGDIVIYPIFGIEEDRVAERVFSELFGSKAIPVVANEIAKKGGALNCISWNIFKS